MRAVIDTEFKGRDDFWRVLVRVDEPPPDESTIPPEKVAVKGAMSDERRSRIREALVDRFQATRAPRAPKLLTRQQTARFLSVSLPTLHEWTMTGKITASRIGTRVRYYQTDVEAALTQITTGRRVGQ